MEENSNFRKVIRKSIFSFIIVLIAVIIGLIILKYHVEGEQNMPFDLAQVLVVSSAEGYQNEESKNNKWDVKVYQTNDIYLNLKKNKNYKETEIIKSVEIKNINIDEKPIVGKIGIYVPDGENQVYNYKEENKINSGIIYTGDLKSNIKDLKISNQGGTVIFRVANETGKNYVSNEDEIKHDGTLLNKVGITNDQIKFRISFDVAINLESGITFTGRIDLNLPEGDITSQGVSNLDKRDKKDIVFKREKAD